MAAKEIYDYVEVAVADNNYTLAVNPHGTIVEEPSRNQAIHEFDDGSEERIDLDEGKPVFYVQLSWNLRDESTSGTIWDFWLDSAKGNGMAKTFKWTHTDGHTYVVRYASNLPRALEDAKIHGFANVRLRIIGKIADA